MARLSGGKTGGHFCPTNADLRPTKTPGTIRAGGFDLQQGRAPDQATDCTDMTSGTKCFSRFSMPFFSVIVELGQPEHEPFMLR